MSLILQLVSYTNNGITYVITIKYYSCVEPSHIRIRIKLLEGRNFAATDDKSPSHLHCVFQMGDTSMKSVDSTEGITNPRI